MSLHNMQGLFIHYISSTIHTATPIYKGGGHYIITRFLVL